MIRRNGFGDLLSAIPMINLIKKQNPAIKITLVVQKSNVELAKYLSVVDHIIVADSRNKYFSAIKLKFLTLFKKYDCAIGMKVPAQNLMNLMLSMINAKYRVAFYNPKRRFAKRINVRINEPSGPFEHVAATYLRLIDQTIEKLSADLYPKLTIPCEIINQYKNDLQLAIKSTPNDDRPVVLISLTNNRKKSTLKTNKLVTILNTINCDNKYNMVLSCMKKDLDQAYHLKDMLNFACRVISTQTLDEFIILLDLSDYVFSGDGGTMHMAAALDKKQLVLFGGTKLKQWQPLSEKAISIQAENEVDDIPNKQIIASFNRLLKS